MDRAAMYTITNDGLRIRDARTERRFFIDNAIILDYGPQLGPYGIAVYAAICMHARIDTQQAWPSHKTIAKEIGCSVPKVKEMLRAMQDLKLLAVDPYHEESGRQTSNTYTLLDPPSLDISDPPDPPDTPPQYNHGSTMNNHKIEQSEEQETATPSADKAQPPHTLNGWLDLLKEPGANRIAVLRWMLIEHFPENDPPPFGKVGGIAKRLHAGRLAELIWQNSGKRITGCPLDYISGVARGRSSGGNGDRARSQQSTISPELQAQLNAM